MQGDQREGQLIESLMEAVEYAQLNESDLRWQNVKPPEDATSISQALRQVASYAKQHHCRLLLLCDEIEGLYQLGQQEPQVLSTLRRTLQHNPFIRTILTSTRRLSRLYAVQKQQDTSMFLEGFEPRYLAHFDDHTANQIIRCTQSSRALTVDEQFLSKIRSFSGNHPLILQKICSQLFNPKTGTLNNFIENEFVIDDQLSGTFQQDFDSLSPDEARVLLQCNTQVSTLEEILQAIPDISPHSIRRILRDLMQLGFLRRVGRSYQIGNIPLQQWLTSVSTPQTQGGITNRMSHEVSQERLISLQRQLIAYTRRLERLKMQQFETGDIEEYQKKIAQIEIELTELGENIEYTVFVSYSHKNEVEKNKLISHLGILQKEGLIDLWSDDQIGPGSDREVAINQAIAQASVAVLLISADFLNSNSLNKTIPYLLKRREQEELIIFPVIAKDCAWQTVDWLAKMSVRPKDNQPIWRGDDSRVEKELAAIAEEIAGIVKGKYPIL